MLPNAVDRHLLDCHAKDLVYEAESLIIDSCQGRFLVVARTHPRFQEDLHDAMHTILERAKERIQERTRAAVDNDKILYLEVVVDPARGGAVKFIERLAHLIGVEAEAKRDLRRFDLHELNSILDGWERARGVLPERQQPGRSPRRGPARRRAVDPGIEH
jgi:hypothetical protein